MNWNHPLNQGLTTWWQGLPGRTGGRLFDLARAGVHGTLSNGPKWVDGENGLPALQLLRAYSQTVSTLVSLNQSAGTVHVRFRPDESPIAAGDTGGMMFSIRTSAPSTMLFDVSVAGNGSGGKLWFAGWYNNGNDTRVGSVNPGVSDTTMQDGKWMDVAVSWDATATSLHVNGAVYAQYVTAPATWSTGAVTAYVGWNSYPGQSQYWNMTLGSLRIYSRALSTTEIAGLYQQSKAGYPDLLRRGNRRTYFPQTQAARPGTPVQRYDLSAPAKVDAASPVDWNHPLNRGLTSWWLPLPANSRSGKVYDLARYGTHGTLVNAPRWVGGPNGFPALAFDGSSSYVSNPSVAGLDGAAACTLAGWIGRSSSGETAGFGGINAPNGSSPVPGNGRFSFLWYNNDYLYLNVDRNDGTYAWGYCALAGVGWHHVCAAYDGSQGTNAAKLKLYIDGVPQSVAFPAVTLPTTLATQVNSFAWGADSTNRFCPGPVTDTRVYARTLSGPEVAQLYDQSRRGNPNLLRHNPKLALLPIPPAASAHRWVQRYDRAAAARIDSGGPLDWNHPLNKGLTSAWFTLPTSPRGGKLLDVARGGYHGTLTNGPRWVAGKNGFGAMAFDGSDDRVEFGADIVAATDSFTLAVAYCPDADIPSATSAIAGRGSDGSGSGSSFFLRQNATTGYLDAGVVTTSGGATTYQATDTKTVAAGVWHHAVVVWNPNDLAYAYPLVVDSFTESNGSPITAPHVIAPTNAPFGSSSTAWTLYNGTFDVQSGRANNTSGSANSFGAIAYCDCGRSDVVITATANLSRTSGPASVVYLVFRWQDSNNFWLLRLGKSGSGLQGLSIYERVAGTFNQRAADTTFDPTTADHTLKVVLNGTSIIGTVDGANAVTYTSSNGQTATIHGFGSEAAGDRHDDFTILGIGAAPVGLTLYVNGVAVAANATTSTSLRTSTIGFRLGDAVVQGTYPCRGKIGPAMLWVNRALSAGEVAGLYAQHQAGYPDMLRRLPSRYYATATVASATTHAALAALQLIALTSPAGSLMAAGVSTLTGILQAAAAGGLILPGDSGTGCSASTSFSGGNIAGCVSGIQASVLLGVASGLLSGGSGGLTASILTSLAGGLVLGADSPVLAQASLNPQGGLLLGGSGGIVTSATLSPSAGLILGGLAGLSGSGDLSGQSGGQQHDGGLSLLAQIFLAASGGLILGGGAGISGSGDLSGDSGGGSTLPGDLALLAQVLLAAQGGLIRGGSAVGSASASLGSSGGVLGGAAGSLLAAALLGGSGSLTLAGDSSGLARATTSPAGGVVFGGAGSLSSALSLAASGIRDAGAAAAMPVAASLSPGGLLLLGGGASPSGTASLSPAATMVLGSALSASLLATLAARGVRTTDIAAALSAEASLGGVGTIAAFRILQIVDGDAFIRLMVDGDGFIRRLLAGDGFITSKQSVEV